MEISFHLCHCSQLEALTYTGSWQGQDNSAMSWDCFCLSRNTQRSWRCWRRSPMSWCAGTETRQGSLLSRLSLWSDEPTGDRESVRPRRAEETRVLRTRTLAVLAMPCAQGTDQWRIPPCGSAGHDSAAQLQPRSLRRVFFENSGGLQTSNHRARQRSWRSKSCSCLFRNHGFYCLPLNPLWLYIWILERPAWDFNSPWTVGHTRCPGSCLRQFNNLLKLCRCSCIKT